MTISAFWSRQLTAGSVLIGKAGERVDEKTGRWWTGGLIALLIGIAASTG
jgi:hypothetical protein